MFVKIKFRHCGDVVFPTKPSCTVEEIALQRLFAMTATLSDYLAICLPNLNHPLHRPRGADADFTKVGVGRFLADRTHQQSQMDLARHCDIAWSFQRKDINPSLQIPQDISA